MFQVPHLSALGPYVLATGETADYRLRLLHNLYGSGTHRVLLEAGLRPGMRVGDLGCGVGMVTALLAELVGPDGHVVGIDASAAQIAQARKRMHPARRNTTFVVASAVDTGQPPASFDLVYCRFLLLHLPEPERALREMHTLLKPNGVLVCEDGDLTSAGSEPPSALDTFADFFGRLGPTRGVDYTLGRRLFAMIQAAGFPEPEITFNQPVRARGEDKRLLELSIAEAGPALLDAGLITAEQLEHTLTAMRRLNADETVLAMMPRMSQVWARKASSPSPSTAGAEAANDRLIVNALSGDDVVDASGLTAPAMPLTADDDGDDTLLGNGSRDVLVGEPGIRRSGGPTSPARSRLSKRPVSGGRSHCASP